MDPTNAAPADACKAVSMVEAAVAKCQAAAVELAAVATKEEQSKGKGSAGLEASKEMASAAEKLAAAAYEVAAAKRLLHDVTRALAEAATADAAASSQALVDLLGENEDGDDDDDFPISDEVAAATALASDAIVTMASTQAIAFAAGKEAAAALSFAGAAATFAASPTDFRAFTWDVDLEEMIKEEDTSEDNMSAPLKTWNLSEAAEEMAVNALETLDGAAHGAHRILAKVLRRPPPGPVIRRGDKNQKPPKDGAIGHKMLMTGKAGVEAAKSLHRAALLIQRQMAKEGHVLSLEQALRIITSPRDLYPPFIPSQEHPLPPEHVYPHVIIPTAPTVILPPRVLLPEEFKIPQVPPKIPEVPPLEKKTFDWLKLVRRTLGTALVKTGLERVFKDYKPDWKAFGKPSVDETPEPPEDLY